ncbi:MAG: hypothetical protein AAF318_01470 [Pseudomonadota bacterium]
MVRRREPEGCGRTMGARDTALSDAGFDPIETTILAIARFYWQAFAIPESQSWLRALHLAEERFGPRLGQDIGLGVLSAVQAMRMSRRSCFQFNNPQCTGCAVIVSEHEQHFMAAFRAIRQGSLRTARTHAMILCEGNDATAMLDRMGDLAHAAYPQAPTRNWLGRKLPVATTH